MVWLGVQGLAEGRRQIFGAARKDGPALKDALLVPMRGIFAEAESLGDMTHRQTER